MINNNSCLTNMKTNKLCNPYKLTLHSDRNKLFKHISTHARSEIIKYVTEQLNYAMPSGYLSSANLLQIGTASLVN